MNYYNYMNKLEFLFAIYKYLKASLFQCQSEVTILHVGIAKTGQDPPEASLIRLQSQGNAHNKSCLDLYSVLE